MRSFERCRRLAVALQVLVFRGRDVVRVEGALARDAVGVDRAAACAGDHIVAGDARAVVVDREALAVHELRLPQRRRPDSRAARPSAARPGIGRHDQLDDLGHRIQHEAGRHGRAVVRGTARTRSPQRRRRSRRRRPRRQRRRLRPCAGRRPSRRPPVVGRRAPRRSRCAAWAMAALSAIRRARRVGVYTLSSMRREIAGSQDRRRGAHALVGQDELADAGASQVAEHRRARPDTAG